MKNTFVPIVSMAAALSLTACGGGAITAQEARGAMPSSSQATIPAPESSSSAQALSAAGSTSADATVAMAPFAAESRALAHAVNGGVVWTLDLVQLVAALPPTSCTGDTCTWGPGSGALDLNDWKLTVTKIDDHYAWSLAGQPKARAAAGFATIVSGNAWPSGVPHVGHGDVLFDLDAGGTLDHLASDPAGTGKITVAYDNRAGRTLDVEFLGMTDEHDASQRANARYRYADGAAGGDLQVATKNTTTNATLGLHSRWLPGGAGRGDAVATDANGTWQVSECWGAGSDGFALVYQLSTPAQASDTGSESACAFAPASYPEFVSP